jgi:hypothetical protein
VSVSARYVKCQIPIWDGKTCIVKVKALPGLTGLVDSSFTCTSMRLMWPCQTTPISILLIAASFLSAVYLFTRIKLYRLHHRSDPVSSPNARFVSAQLDFEPLEPPSLVSRISSGTWYAFSYSWRWLLGMKPPTRAGQLPGRTSRVQQLEVWAPGQFETVLFTVYSPAHAFLWMATGSSNWISMLVVMGLVGVQVASPYYSPFVAMLTRAL